MTLSSEPAPPSTSDDGESIVLVDAEERQTTNARTYGSLSMLRAEKYGQTPCVHPQCDRV